MHKARAAGSGAPRLAFALLLACLAISGCGGSDSGGSKTLSLFIFNEPSGVLETVAQKCSEEADGAYTIEFEYLPSDADGQREQLVRRLGAEDPSIDLIGMDVIWTGEFANAGWLVPFPGTSARSSARRSSPASSTRRSSRASSTGRRSGPTPSCSGTAATSSTSPRRRGTR